MSQIRAARTGRQWCWALGGGRGDVCVFVGMCVSVCMQGLEASQHVCARPGVCVCVTLHPVPGPPVCL